MTKNAVKREIPDYIEGYGKVKHYQGAFAKKPEGNIAGAKLRCFNSDNTDKTVSSIKEAIRASGLKSGMTISFHHHLRNGDYVVNMVLEVAGSHAALACRAYGIDTVIVTGGISAAKRSKEVYDNFSRLYHLNYIVPEHSAYATAIGAASFAMHHGA